MALLESTWPLMPTNQKDKEMSSEEYQPKYWNGCGRFQKEYKRFFNLLVPEKGDAATPIGQLLRYAGNLYYDVFNNGACNFDVREEDVIYLRHRLHLLRETAKNIEVENFDYVARAFLNGTAGPEQCDKFVDVVVKYVADNYEKVKTKEMELIEASCNLLAFARKNLVQGKEKPPYAELQPLLKKLEVAISNSQKM